MAAIEPRFGKTVRLDELVRQSTRLVVVTCYVTAVIVVVLLVRPAFREVEAPARPAVAPVVHKTDVLRKHETVEDFAARHGLELGDLLALNPRVNSLVLHKGTRLRVG